MLEILEGVKVSIKEGVIIAEGKAGVNKRKYNTKLLDVKIEGDKIDIIPIVQNKKLLKVATNTINTLAKCIQNDMHGAQKLYEINMLAVFSHFPITIETKDNKVIIKNILGARGILTTNIIGENTKIDIKGQNVRVHGTSIDDVSQTAANIKRVCKVRKKDERIFQDGVYYAIEQ